MATVRALFVAEKPKVAKSMAQVLNGQQLSGGTSPQNPVHACRGELAFNVEPPPGTRKDNMPHRRNPARKQPAEIRITSVAGHIMEMDFKGSNRKWNTCPHEHLFDAELEKRVPEKFEKCAAQLREQAKWADWLVIWTDYDREGENIGFEIIDICKGPGGNRNLRVHRCGKFSSINAESMEHAMLYCKSPDQAMSDAVEARMELDLRTGAAFTRFQTMLLQNKFDETMNGVISYGPCQFPCMGFVVANHKRIVNFREENFWKLELSVKGNAQEGGQRSLAEDESDEDDEDDEDGDDDIMDEDNRPADNNAWSTRKGKGKATKKQKKGGGGKGGDDGGGGGGGGGGDGDPTMEPLVGSGEPLRFEWARNRVYDENVCKAIYQMVENFERPRPTPARIQSVTGSPTSKQRPAPLNTIKLQMEASRHLRLGAEQTMAIADKLYQEQKLSYPRTETNIWPGDIDAHPLITLQRGHATWGRYAAALLDEGKFKPARDGGETDNSHPPIHPIKLCQPTEFSDPNEKNVYELVTRCFLACFSDDARGQRTSIRATVGYEFFTASGTMVTERNYLDVYRYDKWSGNTIPVFLPGRSYVLNSFTIRMGRTVPPTRLHESELIKRMDDEGIGTDATAASHIETIQKRFYVKKDANGYFSPTELGLALADGYHAMGRGNLIEAKLRKQQEQDCVAIERHGRSKDDVLREQRSTMKLIFQQTLSQATSLVTAAGQHLTQFGAAGGQNQAQIRVVQSQVSACGKCNNGQLMDLKANSAGNDNNHGARDAMFLSCPACSQACFVPSKTIVPVPGEFCPICNFQILEVTRSDGDSAYPICPYCFKNPPAWSREVATSGEMPCFKCSHSECPRAGRAQGSDTPVLRCRSCSTHDMLLNKRKGKYSVSCSGYKEDPKCPAAVWFPAAVASAAVLPDRCRRCSAGATSDDDPRIVRKIRLTCTRRLLPPGFLDGDGPTGSWDVCIICHKSDLSQGTFGANYKEFKSGLLPSGSGNGSGYGGGGGGGGGGARGNRGGVVLTNNNNISENERPQSRLAAAALGLDIEDTVRPSKQRNTGNGNGSVASGGGGTSGDCYRYALLLLSHPWRDTDSCFCPTNNLISCSLVATGVVSLDTGLVIARINPWVAAAVEAEAEAEAEEEEEEEEGTQERIIPCAAATILPFYSQSEKKGRIQAGSSTSAKIAMVVVTSFSGKTNEAEWIYHCSLGRRSHGRSLHLDRFRVRSGDE